jgi:hypothetical protein
VASAAPGGRTPEVTVNIKCLASYAVVVGGVCLAIGAPSAGARPITDLPMHTAAPAHVAVAGVVASPDTPQPQVQQLIHHDRSLDQAVAAGWTPASQVATDGFDWVAWAIGAVAFAAVLGLIWLAAAGISRLTRPRVMHR